MNVEQKTKLEELKTILRRLGGCAVAYSGGVDSGLLLTVAHEVLGDRCFAVIARSPVFPEWEFREAVDWAKKIGATYVAVESKELDLPEFRNNPPNRCYYCKKTIFRDVLRIAAERGAPFVVDGTNADDVRDYRPGMRALAELGVRSPLREANMTKADIRALARDVYHLPMADNPSMACLASRIPYGSPITVEKLRQVEAIEAVLAKMGFRSFRARHHGDILRVELAPEEIDQAVIAQTREAIVRAAKSQGFLYVTLDLEGYRTGSLNEALASSSAKSNGPAGSRT